jgi:hypothetical protein
MGRSFQEFYRGRAVGDEDFSTLVGFYERLLSLFFERESSVNFTSSSVRTLFHQMNRPAPPGALRPGRKVAEASLPECMILLQP